MAKTKQELIVVEQESEGEKERKTAKKCKK